MVGSESPYPGIDVLPDIKESLEEVERRLVEATKVDDPFFSEVTAYLARAGGKRVRPLLALLGARLAGPISEPAIDAAVAVELIHMGSLHHDDVIDESPTRRGRASVNANWGNSVAILAGDLVLARASEIGARLGRTASEMLARTLGEIVFGQMLELSKAYDLGVDESHYRRVVEHKTASLIATSVALGGHVAGLEEVQVDALRRFGIHLGIAFQIADDVLDVVGEGERLGKPVGLDMIEGTYTLPVVYALRTSQGPKLASLLEEIRRAREEDGLVVHGTDGGSRYQVPERMERVVRAAKTILVETGATASALEVARRELDEALGALAGLGDAPALEALVAVGAFVLERVPERGLGVKGSGIPEQ